MGLPGELVHPSVAGAVGGAIAAGTVAGALGLTVGVLGLLGVLGPVGAALGVGATLVLFAGSGVAAGNAIRRRGLHRRVLAEMDAARQRTARHPEAWAALRALQRKSLDADLPVAAQADLWTALDDIERALVDARDAQAIQHALEQAAATLDDDSPASADPVDADLARVLGAVRATRREVEGGSRS